MEFHHCTLDDFNQMMALYDEAIALQKKVFNRHWQPFDPETVKAEIAEKRQWKILIDGKIACIFLTAYSDPAIWAEKDVDPAVYLHRIVTHPEFRGQNLVATIVEWAKDHAATCQKRYLRLDTWGDNNRLKTLYEGVGFHFLGVITPTDTHSLPSHYSCISLALFEIDLMKV
jgi:GNAT superfamily N-acetyltransferase